MNAKRESAGLAAASVVNGLLAYALAVVASRGLSTAGFASYSVAWALWALAVAVLIYPLQHWIAWRAALDGGLHGVWASRWRVAAFAVASVGALALLGLVPRLFPTSIWAFALLVIGSSSVVLGIGRGVLVAEGRVAAVAWVMAIENVVRLLGLLVVVALGSGPVWAAASLGLGVLALLPFVRRVHEPDQSGQPSAVVREVGALAGAAAIAQVLVQFAPVAAEWFGASAATVAAVFATFALARAPVLVAVALTTPLPGILTERLVGNPEAARKLAGGLALLAAVGSGLAAAIGWWALPTAVEWFFGAGRGLPAADSTFVLAGMWLAILGLVLIVALLVLGRQMSSTLMWAMAIVVGVALLGSGMSVSAAFFAAEVLAVGGSLVLLWVGSRAGHPNGRESAS